MSREERRLLIELARGISALQMGNISLLSAAWALGELQIREDALSAESILLKKR